MSAGGNTIQVDRQENEKVIIKLKQHASDVHKTLDAICDEVKEMRNHFKHQNMNSFYSEFEHQRENEFKDPVNKLQNLIDKLDEMTKALT